MTSTTNAYRWLLEETLRAMSITSSTSYSWFGKSSSRLPMKIQRALTPEGARQYLLNVLVARLYKDLYVTGGPIPGTPAPPDLSGTSTLFTAELSTANSGSGFWEQGWKVRHVKDDALDVFRGGLTISARMLDCRVEGGGSFTADSKVNVRFPKEFLGMSPGFYMALGNSPLPRDAAPKLIRLYWNLWPDGAVPFVRLACELFNRDALPFRLKILNNRSLFTRCDGGIIYVLGSDYPGIAGILNKIHRDVKKHLRPETPAFTKQLAPGVGLAESPGGGESFGQHRCQNLAEALILAYEEGKRSVHARLQVVTDYFETHGIRVTQPFLNPGSEDMYEPFVNSLPPEATRPCNTNVVGHLPGRQKQWDAEAADFADSARINFDTAVELGWRLSKTAVWHGNQCNWLGTVPTRIWQEDGFMSVYKPLDGTVYSGTSGVALFLSQLYATCGSNGIRCAAAGAMRHALSHPPHERHGLYTGLPGVLFAAASVGAAIEDQELLDHASQLVRVWAPDYEAPIAFDLVSGRAGTIVALLLLREILHDESLLDIAVTLAGELSEGAEACHSGYSWKSPNLRTQHNLTGFSHGTAGVAYSLLELYRVTEDDTARAVAEQALEYERHWFDVKRGNWPDFRRDRNGGVHYRPPRFGTSWCHGAPGISLARLRAYEILGEERYKEEGIVGLNTTHAALQLSLRKGTDNFSLCHGLAGNAEILLYGRQVLGSEWTDKSGIAFDVARRGIVLSKEHGGVWQCAVDQGETPDLMLGLAGIGYFYLRLYNPNIPSLLAPNSEQFRRRCGCSSVGQ